MCRLSKNSCCTIDSDCSSKGIDIGYTVSHDQDTFPALDQLPERFCLYSGFYSGVLLYLLGFSTIVGAVELKAVVCLYSRLIAASSECKVDRRSCILRILVIGSRVVSDSDTERYRHFVSYFDRLNIFDQAELIFF